MALEIPEAGAWTFESNNIAQNFDEHVRESLPWYDLASGIVVHVVRHYLSQGGLVIDIGASTGNIGRLIAPVLTQRNASLIAIESSEHMAKAYKGPGDIEIGDASDFDFSTYAPDVVIAFLVMMFIPVHKRLVMLERITGALRPGGVLVIFDKLEPISGYAASVISRLALAAKYQAGVTATEIVQKELALAGVQRPLKPQEIIGFVPIFRFGDFGGFIFEKGH